QKTMSVSLLRGPCRAILAGSASLKADGVRLDALNEGDFSRSMLRQNGPSIPHASRDNLVHEHVRGLYPDGDHARKHATHCMSSFLRILLQPLQTCFLDLLDLISHEAQSPRRISAIVLGGRGAPLRCP